MFAFNCFPDVSLLQLSNMCHAVHVCFIKLYYLLVFIVW